VSCANEEWIVRRRYNEFYDLYLHVTPLFNQLISFFVSKRTIRIDFFILSLKLQTNFPDEFGDYREFPPKTYWRRYDQVFIDARRLQLERFLQKVVSHGNVVNDGHVCAFLCLEDRSVREIKSNLPERIQDTAL
jgi:hypothetical protein